MKIGGQTSKNDLGKVNFTINSNDKKTQDGEKRKLTYNKEEGSSVDKEKKYEMINTNENKINKIEVKSENENYSHKDMLTATVNST